MDLTFAEDFTSTDQLDSELIGTPDSGMYWNRGVHPILTINNLLSILPNATFTFTAWDEETTYGKFETSRKKSDVVTYKSATYLSLLGTNLNKIPGTDTTYWLETNINSLRVRAFVWSVEDNFKTALSLHRKLEENQYIYNVGETLQTLSNDYSGWVFEPKGSDYIKIRINQMSLQADTDEEVSLYVINQGILQTTLTLNPSNGLLEFEDIGYTITGKGRFLFVFDSQDVYSENAFNDPLKYDSFVCYPVNGTGDSAAEATYSNVSSGNGLSFNISTYLDSGVYLTNNQIDFSKFMQCQFEYDFIRMALHNANSRSNINERTLTDESSLSLLSVESLNTDMYTVARKYKEEKQAAINTINKTFDKFLKKPQGMEVIRKTI